MDIPIEHIQFVIEDKLTDVSSCIHRYEISQAQYWYYVGKHDAYQEILEIIKENEHINLIETRQ